MANGNRFSGLMGGLSSSDGDSTKTKKSTQKKASQPESKPESKSKKPMPKSKDPNYSQIGIYLPNEIHKKMKIGAAMTGLEMSEIAAQGIQMWLEKNVKNN